MKGSFARTIFVIGVLFTGFSYLFSIDNIIINQKISKEKILETRLDGKKYITYDGKSWKSYKGNDFNNKNLVILETKLNNCKFITYDGGRTWLKYLPTECVKTIAKNNNIAIYPNPFNEYLNVSINSNELTIQKVSIYNLYNCDEITFVRDESSKISKQLIIPATELSPGVYLLRVLFSNNSFYDKIVYKTN